MKKSLCPLCGKENNCYIEKGLDPSRCWCITTKLPNELLERVPIEKKGKSCICKDCIIKYEKEKL